MLGFLVAFSFNFLDSGLLGHWEVGVEGVWDGKESKRGYREIEICTPMEVIESG